MVDQLLTYVEAQLAKGYPSNAIKDALVKQGYSPGLVDGALNSARKNMSAMPAPLGENHEKHTFFKIIFVLVVIGLIALGVSFLPGMLGGRNALLDVKISSLEQDYFSGDDLIFSIALTNSGAKEVNASLTYKIIDMNDNVISTKHESILVKESASRQKTMELPSNLNAGRYVLKAFANYDGKVTSASRSFNVQEKTIAVTESCNDGVQNQNEEGIDCGGVCNGYWYENSCNENPQQGTITPEPGSEDNGTTIEEASCSDGIHNQDETGTDCGGTCPGYWYENSCHENPQQGTITPEPGNTTKPSLAKVRNQAIILAKTDAEGAKELCISELDNAEDQGKCLKDVAYKAMRKDFCNLIQSTSDRDECYYPFFMLGDYSVCQELIDERSKTTCEQLKKIEEIKQSQNQTEQTETNQTETPPVI